MQRVNPLRFVVTLLLCCSFTVVAQQSAKEDKQYQYHIEAQPDWVVAVEQVGAKSDAATDGQHYMLTDNQMKVDDKGQQHYSHYKMRFDHYSAIESGSDIRVRFDPAYEVPYFHGIEVIRDGKRINKLVESKLKFISSEDSQKSNIYGGEVEALMLLEDIRIGDVLEYSYTVKGANPVFDNNFSRFFSLGWGIVVDNAFVRVLSPKSKPLFFKTQGTDVQVKVSELGAKFDNLTEYRLHLTYTPEVLSEDAVPTWYDAYPWVQFSEYESWQDVSQWAYQLFQLEDKLSPELNAFIDSLKGLEKADAISKATSFIQDDIRYLGLELAENSHKPHHPNETFTNRYGDCKDKSLLLSSVLNKLGIDAWPALVSTTDKGHLDKYLPSHGLFDHAIVTIELDGKSIWLDPTVSYQGTSLQSIHQPEYGQALVIKKDSNSLSVAKPSEPVPGTVAIVEEYLAVDYFSPVIWSIKTTYTGKEAERKRYNLSTQTTQKLSRNYLNFYAKTYPKVSTLEPLQVVDDRQKNVLVMNEKYLVPDYWKHADNEASFELYTVDVGDYIRAPKTIIRQQPLAVYQIGLMTHKVTLNMPDDVDFTNSVYNKTVEDQHFSLTSSFDYDRRRLSLTNVYKVKQKMVKALDVADHLLVLNKARKLLSYDGSITNVNDEAGGEPLKTLIQALNSRVKGNQL